MIEFAVLAMLLVLLSCSIYTHIECDDDEVVHGAKQRAAYGEDDEGGEVSGGGAAT